MRITSGSLKGRKLVSPGVKNLRLTEAKVRKAIFDILADSIEGSSVLELFAGSGVLGIEAFSRGAGEVTFVDNNPRCIEAIRENIPQEFREKSHILFQDYLEAIDHLDNLNKKFDLVILDPPYKKGLALLSLKKICQCCILKHYAIIVIEHHLVDDLDNAALDKLQLISRKRYGDTGLTLFRFRAV